MEKLTLKTIRELREKKRKEIAPRFYSKDKKRIVVFMGESGIKAGAKKILKKFADEIDKKNLKNIVITQSKNDEHYGNEPVVEVFIPNRGKVTYKRVTEDLVTEIVNELL